MKLKSRFAFPLLFFLLALAGAALAMSDAGLLGFKPSQVDELHGLERQFVSELKKENIREWIRYMSSRPHHVGSPFGKEIAEFMRDKFESWGFEARIEEYQVLFPTPKTRILEMTEPERFTAKLEEPTLPEDSTSGQKEEQLPSYNAYSVDGDVQGELVYVNYGVPADYEELERRGIDVRGKIVIA